MLEDIVRAVREYEGLLRKKPIHNIVDILKEADCSFDRIIADFGEDSAVIDLDENLLVFAADGVWDRLIKKDPWWAGYCAVLVNVNDVYAMGGEPIGMVNVVSMQNERFCFKAIEGMRDGVSKFNVPMLGGHIHPDSPYNSIDVAIIGTLKKEEIILSSSARIGDDIIFAIDLDGKFYPKLLNWDSTTKKSKEEISRLYGSLRLLAKKALVRSGKDISNPGVLGTLGMLLETSRKGAYVEVEKIPAPKEVEMKDWVRVYPGTGFIFTCDSEKTTKVIDILKAGGFSASCVGKIIEENILFLKHGSKEEVLFNFEEDIITGLRSEETKAK